VPEWEDETARTEEAEEDEKEAEDDEDFLTRTVSSRTSSKDKIVGGTVRTGAESLAFIFEAEVAVLATDLSVTRGETVRIDERKSFLKEPTIGRVGQDSGGRNGTQANKEDQRTREKKKPTTGRVGQDLTAFHRFLSRSK
jgi:hypothetical protein